MEGRKAAPSENSLTPQASSVDAFFGAFMEIANNLTDVPVTEVEIGQAMGTHVSESADAYIQQ